MRVGHARVVLERHARRRPVGAQVIEREVGRADIGDVAGEDDLEDLLGVRVVGWAQACGHVARIYPECVRISVRTRQAEQGRHVRLEFGAHALAGDQRRSRDCHRMRTVLPTGILGYRSTTSATRMRMHPCDARLPIESSAAVPWIPTPPTMPSQRAFSGLSAAPPSMTSLR